MNETMLENGLDFILDSAQQLSIAENSKDDSIRAKAIKYSLLHLLSGIELVMKARLYLENWTYIFDDMNKAKREELDNGSLKTVDSSKCVDRLERLCDVGFTENDKKAFENLRKKRNEVEHFKVTDSVCALETVINHALSATMTFLEKCNGEFNSPSIVDTRQGQSKIMSAVENQLMDEITRVASELEHHHLKAIELANDRADKQGCCLEEDRLDCPSCGEKFLVPLDGECHCYLCGYNADGEMAAKKYLSNVRYLDEYRIVKGGGRYPIYICPECGKSSFIDVGDKYECFSCKMSYQKDEIDFCSGL